MWLPLKGQKMWRSWGIVLGSWVVATPLGRAWALQVIRVPTSPLFTQFCICYTMSDIWICYLWSRLLLPWWSQRYKDCYRTHDLAWSFLRPDRHWTVTVHDHERNDYQIICKANTCLRGPQFKLFISQMRTLRYKESK